jgi:DNA-binding transcriptional regulator YdaS (Cro superfamily)
MSNKALERAIAIVGSQGQLAKRIGRGRVQANISLWLHRDRQGVPAEFCLAVEQATGGLVTRYELRPDVFGEPPVRRRRKAEANP